MQLWLVVPLVVNFLFSKKGWMQGNLIWWDKIYIHPSYYFVSIERRKSPIRGLVSKIRPYV